MRRLAFLVAACLVVVPATRALAALHVPFQPANPHNYSHHPRRASAIRLLVVHVTEGTFASAVAWFQNPHAHVSAHFVVSRDGAVTQMVPLSRVAWHAGNAWVNAHSIGIENEGYTGVDSTFTDAEYRASAELSATVLRRYLLPIDRRHLIGHAEVPDPSHPGLSGGYAHHTDPGRYWDWRRFLAYTQSYAHGVTPPPLPFEVANPAIRITAVSVYENQTLAGQVHVEAAVRGTPIRVEFLVDGVVRDIEAAAPYILGGATGSWDTTKEANGPHTLFVRAIGPNEKPAATRTIHVVVANP